MNKKKSFFSGISTTDKIAIAILAIGFVGMFLLPYVITQKTWNYDLGVSKSNEIGDTLGGILSPFVGLISAFLVYLALREQVKANKILGDQFKDSKIEKFEKFISVEVERQLISVFEELNVLSQSTDFLRKKDFDVNRISILISKLISKQDLNVGEIGHLNIVINNLVKALKFFLENVNVEKAFYILVKIRIEEFSRAIYKSEFGDFTSKFKNKNYSNGWITNNSSLGLSKILDYFEVEKQVLFRSRNIEEYEKIKEFIPLLKQIVKDLNTKCELIKRYRNLEEGIKNHLATKNNSEISILLKEHFKNKFDSFLIVKEALNLEFDNFLDRIKNETIYIKHIKTLEEEKQFHKSTIDNLISQLNF